MADERPISERVQDRVKPHPDDTHESTAEAPAVPAPEEKEALPKAPEANPAPAQKAKPKFGTFDARLARMETHHSGLWEFDFELEEEMHFIPGQYVSVLLDNMKPAPFSIAGSAAEQKKIVLGIEVVGEVTTAMSLLRPGDSVKLKGPFGNFVIGDHERKVCFLAGGIGITPFMSMLRTIRDTHPDKYAVLFYSCKTEDQIMWREELEKMQHENDNIKIILTVTREEPKDWPHKLGRISESLIREELPDFDEYVFFSCGPKNLIDCMFGLLEGMGVQKERLRREAWH